MRKAIGLFLVGMAAAGIVCSRAEAGLVTVHIQGEIDFVYDYANLFAGNISVGDLFTGSCTYETTLEDTAPGPTGGNYLHEDYHDGFKLSVKGYEFKLHREGKFRIVVANDSLGLDAITYRNLGSFVTPDISTEVWKMFWCLQDSTGTALSDSLLPIEPPVLSDWSTNYILLKGPDRGLTFELIGHVTSASVPEPATVLLFCIGGLFLRRRK